MHAGGPNEQLFPLCRRVLIGRENECLTFLNTSADALVHSTPT